MKILSHKFYLILVLFLIVNINSVYAQNNSGKNSKGKKIESKIVEVKVNLMILNADGKFADNVKLEDLKIYEDGIEQKITYFIKKEPILNLGLVVDNTGSMRDKLSEIHFAASTIVSNLNENDEAFLIRFVSSDNVNVIQDWTSDKKKLNSAIQDMYVEGGQTAIIDALYLSAQKLAEGEKLNKSKRYALILISDSVDRHSYYTLDEMLELFKNTDLQIFSFSFPVEEEFKSAKESRKQIIGSKGKKPILLNNILALKTGGAAYTLNKKYTKEEIAEALKKFIIELRSQYIVGYTSTNQNRDGLSRKIIVQIADDVKGEKRQAVTRENFIVPKN